MPRKLISRPAKIKLRVPSARVKEDKLFVESNLNGGMVTSIDPQNLQPTQQELLKNFVVRYDHTNRRYGSTKFTPEKPNSSKILLWTNYSKSDDSTKLLRFTKDDIYYPSGGAWVEITGAGFTGSDTDRWRTVQIDDRFFATNNGVDEIIEIDTNTDTYFHAGNAPRYKYIIGLGDRLVGFFRGGGAPVGYEMGWSGQRNYDEWNPLVDISAGSKLLTTSSSESSDDISGAVSFTNQGIIIREKSIWLATLQPIASNPFNTTQAIPNVGSDAPDSIVKIPGGVAFVDTRTRAVYVYTTDQRLDVISSSNREAIFGQYKDPKSIFSAYNQTTNELSICFPDTTSEVTPTWVYSFESKCWWYEERRNVSTMSNLDYLSSALTIDDLVGTIDELIGSIDSLTSGEQVTKFYGNTTGDLYYEDPFVDTDDGEIYTSEFISKVFTFASVQETVKRSQFQYIGIKAGSMLVQFSRDDGVNWSNLMTITYNNSQLNVHKHKTGYKNFLTSDFKFKITATSGLFELVRYLFYIEDNGAQKDE